MHLQSHIPLQAKKISRKQLLTISIVLVCLFGIPTTIFLLSQNQDSRSQAAYFTDCTEQKSALFNKQAVQEDTLQRDTKVVEETVNTSLFSSTPDVETFRPAIARRKKQLVQAMRSDPKVALQYVLSQREQEGAQVLSSNCVEEFTVVQGYLDAYVIDYTDQTSEVIYSVTTEAGDHVTVHTTEQLPELSSSTAVKISGYKLDQELLVDTQNAANFEVVQTASQSHAQGNQKTAVILARMQNSSPSVLTKEQIDGSIMANANNYYKENSYNKTDLSWTTYGWYTIPQMSSCDPNLAINNAVQAANADIDYKQFSRVVIFMTDMTALSCPFDGLGNIGVAPKQMPDGVVTNSITLVAMKANTSTIPIMSLVVTHELGHNMGVHHASALNCGSQSLAASGCTHTSTPQLEYGDLFNVMGNRVAHMSAPHKEYIGWLNPNQVQEVKSSGTFTLEPMGSQSTGLKAIKIPRGNGDFLYVEYRQPLGFDSQIGNVGNSDIFQGALLHTLVSDKQTLLIDASPPMDMPFTFSPALLPNRAFTDPVTGVSLMVTTISSNNLTVEVAYPGTTLNPTTTVPSVTNTPTTTPTITLSPTGTVKPSSSPTTTQQPTTTRTPSPTPVTLQLSLAIKGVGNTAGANSTPNPFTVNAYGEVYDQQNTRVQRFTTELWYSSATGTFNGAAATQLPPGQYAIRLNTGNSLWSKGTLTQYASGNNEVRTESVILGDFNGDNQITMGDHSMLVSCYGKKRCSSKTRYDLNFDGQVNGVDYNIFISNLLQKRTGD